MNFEFRISNYECPLDSTFVTHHSKLLAGLTRFQPVILVGVSNAFTFISVGLSKAVQFSGNLPELLLINTAQGDRSLILVDRRLGIDALGLGIDTFRQRIPVTQIAVRNRSWVLLYGSPLRTRSSGCQNACGPRSDGAFPGGWKGDGIRAEAVH